MSTPTKPSKPETAGQAAAWTRRRNAYRAAGVGADNVCKCDCTSQAAYAAGESYGPPRPACDPCAAVMAEWPTRFVAGTSYRRVPGQALSIPATCPQPEPLTGATRGPQHLLTGLTGRQSVLGVAA